MKNNYIDLFSFVFFLSLAISAIEARSNLKTHFYRKSCPNTEQIVRQIIWRRVADNPELAPKFLRMFFHDCFVEGCDGSILINSTADNTAEKDAIPNQTLAGFEILDEVKAALEKACPNTVSCADILALSARDSVSYQFRRDLWRVQLGRRDGRVSLASRALANIPSPFLNFSSLVASFAAKTLSVRDLVVLSGGHTIGIGHCGAFRNRLFNFSGRGDSDPSLDPKYAAFLRTKCRNPSDNTTTVALDPGSQIKFDSHYYLVLKGHRGLFQSDAALLTNRLARRLVDRLANPATFLNAFKHSIKRMGAIVPSASNGEIRRKCSVINQ